MLFPLLFCLITPLLANPFSSWPFFVESTMRASNFKVLAAPALRLGRAIAVTAAAAIAVSGAASPALAASPPPLTARAMVDAMNQASAAVVGISVTAIEGARSVQTLGRQRSGSGVVIGSDGLILTIGYLMLEAETVEIITQASKAVPAVVVAYDSATGFGLLRPLLPAQLMRGVVPVKLGTLQDLKPGEPLMAATGATAGGKSAGISLTQLVSKRAFSGTWEYHLDTALFTSPPVSSGGGNHSGAPLFNHRGELVGIGSLLVADALGEKGTDRRMPGNMFVPADLLKPILAEMQRSGSSSQSHRPWLGLTSSDRGGRVQIMRVSADSPADDAGLQAGHIVLAVDGVAVSTLEGFYKTLWAHCAADEPVKLTIGQDDEVKTITITPQDRMLTLRKPAGI